MTMWVQGPNALGQSQLLSQATSRYWKGSGAGNVLIGTHVRLQGTRLPCQTPCICVYIV